MLPAYSATFTEQTIGGLSTVNIKHSGNVTNALFMIRRTLFLEQFWPFSQSDCSSQKIRSLQKRLCIWVFALLISHESGGSKTQSIPVLFYRCTCSLMRKTPWHLLLPNG